jgi:hypothetical protein
MDMGLVLVYGDGDVTVRLACARSSTHIPPIMVEAANLLHSAEMQYFFLVRCHARNTAAVEGSANAQYTQKLSRIRL